MEVLNDYRIRHWWVFLIRGLLFLLVGIYMIASPAESFAALGLIFGFIILITGIVELIRVFSDKTHAGRSWHLLLGIIDVILGIILVGNVGASETILRFIAGVWFLFRGLSMLSFSNAGGRSWLITLGGILIVLLGLMVLFNPIFGALTIVLWTAWAFIITGIFNIILGFRLR